jgi:hypothetical protein
MSAKKKAARLRVWRFTDHVYDVSVFLLKGTGDDAIRWFAKQFEEPIDPTQQFTGAKTIFVDHARGTALVLWFPDWWDATSSHHLGVLAHEAQHGTFMTLTERGCQWTRKGDEAFNYHTAWLFREAHRRLTA